MWTLLLHFAISTSHWLLLIRVTLQCPSTSKNNRDHLIHHCYLQFAICNTQGWWESWKQTHGQQRHKLHGNCKWKMLSSIPCKYGEVHFKRRPRLVTTSFKYWTSGFSMRYIMETRFCVLVLMWIMCCNSFAQSRTRHSEMCWACMGSEVAQCPRVPYSSYSSL